MTKGLVRIRLSRQCRKNTPFYNIVVTQSFKARDAKPIEVIGTYNPIPIQSNITKKKKTNAVSVLPYKDIRLDFERAKYWIGVGAQPTETMTKILIKGGILGKEWNKYEAKNTRKVIRKRLEVEE
ncbi:hypothetical protein TBLA_0G02730 [Henningerozyma blattae CBS 6284]|uniref:Ribosomal protein S16 n=1 Tax=Henningerozyma blattae (strain ATCC 34711 / CBS 6284 / DSM 70876 / NBRC 10599 / NRRL Y-10934 / UCD 77-7) TaxID=1071380 RepID=I2H759_HENB6|nr:hypothetical protein TBLA_0G02730 [Tetrapisispora blattae CBS 6284]CCH62211.1 hypothetical protein TBLA_0G02730 [Tetrapisispora blattae CBS 6284]